MAPKTGNVLFSNIVNVVADRNIHLRALTIALVGPSAVVLAACSKYTCALLIWFFFFFGMLEWSGIKRHIKVALLLGVGMSCVKDTDSVHLPSEFAAPIAAPNKVVVAKTILSSFVAVAASMGTEAFSVFMVLYFLGWTLLTLCCQNGLEMKAHQAKKAIDHVATPEGLDKRNSFPAKGSHEMVVQLFYREELRMIVEKQPTELLLNFCLEYFGFVWITGVTYPLLVYDWKNLGKPWILASLVGNFAGDIVALLVGRVLKNKTHPLSLAISPRKSMEGAISGIIANAVVFASILYFMCGSDAVLSLQNTYYVNVMVGFLLGAMGVLGDLLQSLLKRTARVKDSGYLMPGHGGVLDRIDGLLLVFPAMYCCMRVIGAFS